WPWAPRRPAAATRRTSRELHRPRHLSPSGGGRLHPGGAPPGGGRDPRPGAEPGAGPRRRPGDRRAAGGGHPARPAPARTPPRARPPGAAAGGALPRPPLARRGRGGGSLHRRTAPPGHRLPGTAHMTTAPATIRRITGTLVEAGPLPSAGLYELAL